MALQLSFSSDGAVLAGCFGEASTERICTFYVETGTAIPLQVIVAPTIGMFAPDTGTRFFGSSLSISSDGTAIYTDKGILEEYSIFGAWTPTVARPKSVDPGHSFTSRVIRLWIGSGEECAACLWSQPISRHSKYTGRECSLCVGRRGYYCCISNLSFSRTRWSRAVQLRPTYLSLKISYNTYSALNHVAN